MSPEELTFSPRSSIEVNCSFPIIMLNYYNNLLLFTGGGCCLFGEGGDFCFVCLF